VSQSVLTPSRAAQQMLALTRCLSGEALHRAADLLMCEIMESAGYGEAVSLFLEAVGSSHSDDNHA
jgi:hypothetical protein